MPTNWESTYGLFRPCYTWSLLEWGQLMFMELLAHPVWCLDNPSLIRLKLLVRTTLVNTHQRLIGCKLYFDLLHNCITHWWRHTILIGSPTETYPLYAEKLSTKSVLTFGLTNPLPVQTNNILHAMLYS